MLHVMPQNEIAQADPTLLEEKVSVVAPDHVQGASGTLSGSTNPTDDEEFRPKGHIDFSKPFTTNIKEETIAIHEEIHHSAAASTLVNGQLVKSEYIRFLFMLWHVYDALERGLYEHKDHPVIHQIYHPRVFSRATALSFDICHHLDTVTWQTDPFYVNFYNNIPKAVQTYVDRLAYLGRPEATRDEVALLAAHAYVRYLGDLSGGQIIRRKIIKAYDLYDDGDGIAFYNFRTLDPRTGDKPAESHEVRKIKEWFKEGLEESVTDPKMKIAIITEANRAFRYNAELFACLDPKKTLDAEPLRQSSAVATTGASLGAIFALVLAVSMAHFILVVGGFTGSSGLNKLDTVFAWVKHEISTRLDL